MAIKNGLPHDADEVMNALGTVFKNQATLIWDADLKGFDSDLNLDLKNVFYDTLNEEGNFTNVDATSSFKKSPIIPCSVIDEHDDGSVDTDIWEHTIVTSSGHGPSGGVSESTVRMLLQSGAGSAVGSGTRKDRVMADQVNASSIGNQSLIFRIKVNAAKHGSGGSSYKRIIIRDETGNQVTLGEITSTSITNYRINIDKTNETAKISTDLNETGVTDIDLSSLDDTETWRIGYETNMTSGGTTTFRNSTMEIYVTRKLDAEDESIFLLDYNGDVSDTINDCIFVTSKEELGTGAFQTFEIASDGTNYEEVTDTEIHRFTDTGSSPKVKLTLKAQDATYPEIAQLNHFAVWYNTGAQ
jgi:hypothetical protein